MNRPPALLGPLLAIFTLARTLAAAEPADPAATATATNSPAAAAAAANATTTTNAAAPAATNATAAIREPEDADEAASTNATSSTGARRSRGDRRDRRNREDRGDRPSSATATTNEPAASVTTGSRVEFSAFRGVGDRNIFNPNRSARSPRGGETRRPARVDTVSLVGTLSYHQGDFAFFDGSSPAFRKAARTNETVADFRVATIGTDEVTLEVNGKPVTVRVGARFRREEDGPWEVASTGASTAATAASTEAAGAGSSNGNDSAPSGAASDILARLRQKREQELKNENP